MKNLLVLEPEKLEELPKRQFEKYSKHSGRWTWRANYPYGKVENFLKANKGKHIDEVYSKYCKLEWLDKSFKNREWFSKSLCLTTEMRDGEVWYQGKWGGIFHPVGGGYTTDLFYIHPETRKVEYWHRSFVNYKKRREQEEAKLCRILGDYHQLLKLDGIWHEVKAEPAKSDVIIIDSTHWQITNLKPVWSERRSEHVKGVERELLLPVGIKEYKIVDGKIAIPYVSHPPYWNEVKPPGKKDIMITDIDRYGSVLKNGWTWKNGIKVLSCKQVGHKTLRKYGLRNDPRVEGPKCKKCGGIAGKTCLYHICPRCKKYYREDCKCRGY